MTDQNIATALTRVLRSKTVRITARLLFFLFLALSGIAQTYPPNDNYTNRTELIGTDLIFSGPSLTATVENNGEATIFYSGGLPSTQSVWWKWIAPVTTSLTLHILANPSDSSSADALVVYTNTDLANEPMYSTYTDSYIALNKAYPINSISFPVTAGMEYDFLLIGRTILNASIHLIATNTPVILQQPVSETVYSNASVLFYVVYAGVNQSAFTFQWLHNGTNLPDETAPMIVLANIDSNLSGAYSVVVSNAAGYTVSQPAILTVSQSNYPVTLAVTSYHSNSLAFNLNGENGRGYRLLSSTNLIAWNREYIFPYNYFGNLGNDVIFNTNSPLPITVSNNLPGKFYRMQPYIIDNPDAEICINNLRQIRIAEFLCQRDYNLPLTATTHGAQIQPYFPHHILPICPSDLYQTYDTSYTPGILENSPYCKVVPTNHYVEELR